jgi:GDP-D-mannose 3', 5'-epimerase
MKKVLVAGAGGFIGNHLVRKLKNLNYYVVGVDLTLPQFSPSLADEFIIGDLRDQIFTQEILEDDYSEVYQLAADMGGAGYLFTGENDADIMYNSSLINFNILNSLRTKKCKVFYSSSACVYPFSNQADENNPVCVEDSIYPANPDSNYGWEKLYSERLFLSFAKNYGLEVRIARLHNVFGPEGTYKGGREKSIAALCRKIIEAKDYIEIWGDGEQTRSYLFIDECVEGIIRLMNSKCGQPVNLGSENLMSINGLVSKIMGLENKILRRVHKEGPLGVRGRRSDNKLILEELGWKPRENFDEGLIETYFWIKDQIEVKVSI